MAHQFIVLGEEAFLIISDELLKGKRQALLFDYGVAFSYEWPADTSDFIREYYERYSYTGDPALIPEDVVIVGVIVSHAHTDHCGGVPALEETGKLAPAAKVWATIQTHRLMEMNMMDTLDFSPYLYDIFDVVTMIGRREILPLGEFTIGPFEIYSFTTGHITGAISCVVRIDGKNYCLIGDRSWHDQATIKGANLFSESIPKKWWPDSFLSFDPFSLFGEVFDYTGKRLSLIELVRTNLYSRFLASTLAIARGSNVVLELRDCPIPKYLDGNTRVSAQISEEYDQISHEEVYLVKNVEERLELANSREPAFIAASSGMDDRGAIVAYLPKILADPAAFYIITSFTPLRSKNEEILQKSALSTPQTVMIGDKEIPLLCTVVDSRFSGHGHWQAACYDLWDLKEARGKKLERMVIRVPRGLFRHDVVSFLRTYITNELILATPGTTINL